MNTSIATGLADLKERAADLTAQLQGLAKPFGVSAVLGDVTDLVRVASDIGPMLQDLTTIVSAIGDLLPESAGTVASGNADLPTVDVATHIAAFTTAANEAASVAGNAVNVATAAASAASSATDTLNALVNRVDNIAADVTTLFGHVTSTAAPAKPAGAES
jgi:hypothetical protein